LRGYERVTFVVAEFSLQIVSAKWSHYVNFDIFIETVQICMVEVQLVHLVDFLVSEEVVRGLVHCDLPAPHDVDKLVWQESALDQDLCVHVLVKPVVQVECVAFGQKLVNRGLEPALDQVGKLVDEQYE